MLFINAVTWFLFFLGIAQKRACSRHMTDSLCSHCFLIAPCIRSYNFFLSAINVSKMCLIPNFIFIFSTLCSVKSNLAELSSSFYWQSLMIFNDKSDNTNCESHGLLFCGVFSFFLHVGCLITYHCTTTSDYLPWNSFLSCKTCQISLNLLKVWNLMIGVFYCLVFFTYQYFRYMYCIGELFNFLTL